MMSNIIAGPGLNLTVPKLLLSHQEKGHYSSWTEPFKIHSQAYKLLVIFSHRHRSQPSRTNMETIGKHFPR